MVVCQCGSSHSAIYEWLEMRLLPLNRIDLESVGLWMWASHLSFSLSLILCFFLHRVMKWKATALYFWSRAEMHNWAGSPAVSRPFVKSHSKRAKPKREQGGPRGSSGLSSHARPHSRRGSSCPSSLSWINISAPPRRPEQSRYRLCGRALEIRPLVLSSA